MTPTPKLPWTTPRMAEVRPEHVTREARIEYRVWLAETAAREHGRSEAEALLIGEVYRYLAALEEIAAHPCRRLNLRDNRQGWDCQQLGAPLCEACIASEAIRGGSGGAKQESLPGLEEESDAERRRRFETGWAKPTESER